ncbi:MAG: nitroreductase family protein [Acidimicrobiales bacterium]
MELERALQTTGAVRDFAGTPVPDEVLYRVLDTARFAPSGGNRQAWRLVVARDPALRRRLRDLYLDAWYQYLAMGQAGLVAWAPVTDREAEARAIESTGTIRSAAFRHQGFAERLDEVPVLLVLLADLRGLAAVDRDFDRYTMVGGASIYPFAWSILLAAHGAGLGGVFTTMLVRSEPEVLTLLEVPDGWVVAGALALGYPAGGRRPTKLRRGRVESFTTVDRFGGAPLAAGAQPARDS